MKPAESLQISPLGAPGAPANLLALIGRRIRQARQSRLATIQELAEQCGISRRLLTQIELGQANPSLTTVASIARVLALDFATLTTGDTESNVLAVVTSEESTLLWSSPQGSSARLLTASSLHRGPELWLWSLAPGDSYTALPDPVGSEELFHVIDGALTITATGHGTTVLQSGDAARLLSDRDYRYVNESEQWTSFTRVVVLPLAGTIRPSGRTQGSR